MSIKKFITRLRTIAGLYFHTFKSNEPLPQYDTGIAEQTIDPRTREPIRTVRRETGSDVTIITERGTDGRMHRHTETPVKQANGSYETVSNAPTAYHFRTR